MPAFDILQDKVKKLEKDNKRLRAALEFYASGSIAAANDGGKRAIEALRGAA